jgi:hypothetical protein
VAGLTATWLRDNKPLQDKLADRVKIMAKENHFTLELQNCMAEDSGQYTCRLTGPAGENITCSAHLEVHKRKSLIYALYFAGSMTVVPRQGFDTSPLWRRFISQRPEAPIVMRRSHFISGSATQ